MTSVKMSPSSTWSHIVLGCAVLIAIQSFGNAMECTTSEDEELCMKSCIQKGYRYGMCDYSDCSCFGRSRRPNGASLMQRNLPADGSKYAPSGATKRPLKCTSVDKTVRFLSDNLDKSSYDKCYDWCRESLLNVYVSFDNLCCCLSK